ncbi:MAG: hypothetical protein ABI351_07490, partial [Herbaspirillum sp.]
WVIHDDSPESGLTATCGRCADTAVAMNIPRSGTLATLKRCARLLLQPVALLLRPYIPFSDSLFLPF